jgi:hypothetical protein
MSVIVPPERAPVSQPGPRERAGLPGAVAVRRMGGTPETLR